MSPRSADPFLDAPSGADMGAREPAERPRSPPLVVLVAVSMAQPFALNAIAPALPGMARLFQTDYATMQLTLSVYLVTVALAQLVVGPISDRLGRRPVVIAALAAFVVASVLSVFATSVTQLIAARALQAAGGGTAFALARAIVRDTSSREEAASRIGYLTMVMVIAPMLAPLAGGYLDTHVGWRSIYLAMGGLGLAGLALAIFGLNETRPPGPGPLALGSVFRSFPVLLRERAFLAFALTSAFTSACFFALIAGAPYLVVNTMGHDASVYGRWFVMNALGYMLGNFVTGRFGARIGVERLVAIGVVATLIGNLGSALWIGFWAVTPAALFVPAMLSAFGNGLTIPGATAGALSVRPDLAGAAAGLTGATQLGFGALVSLLTAAITPLHPAALPALMAACAAAALVAHRALAPRATRGRRSGPKPG